MSFENLYFPSWQQLISSVVNDNDYETKIIKRAGMPSGFGSFAINFLMRKGFFELEHKGRIAIVKRTDLGRKTHYHLTQIKKLLYS